MCVDIRVADWLRSQGSDAVHLREQGLQTLADGEIFVKAAAEWRTVITFDLDFSEIAAFSQRRRVSVIVLRLRNTNFARVIERLQSVLPRVLAVLVEGAVIMIEDARYRIRRLPIK
jgi:predicted nuclease of predicted toxin-antitoxin system